MPTPLQPPLRAVAICTTVRSPEARSPSSWLSVFAVPCLFVSRDARERPQGSRRPKLVRRRPPDLVSISGRAMATAYARWILIGASESPLKMQRFYSAIDLDFRFCIFAMFVLPLCYFLGGSSGSCGPSTPSDGRVTIHCKYAVIGAWASYDFST